jgi:hypothetical protein
LRYSLETKLSAETVRKEALAYFGDRLGLKVTDDKDNALCLEGGGGYVTIRVCSGDKTSVEILTQEWDNAVTDFLTKIRK